MLAGYFCYLGHVWSNMNSRQQVQLRFISFKLTYGASPSVWLIDWLESVFYRFVVSFSEHCRQWNVSVSSSLHWLMWPSRLLTYRLPVLPSLVSNRSSFCTPMVLAITTVNYSSQRCIKLQRSPFWWVSSIILISDIGTSLKRCQLKTAMANMSAIICFIEKEMQRHRENFDPTCIRDFIDLYLKESSGTNRTSLR